MPIHHPLESNSTLWKMLVYEIDVDDDLLIKVRIDKLDNS